MNTNVFYCGDNLRVLRDHVNSVSFKEAISSGLFSEGALGQLRSLGFNAVYFPCSLVTETFTQVGIDATYYEDALDTIFQQKVDDWEALLDTRKTRVQVAILESAVSGLDKSKVSLAESVSVITQDIIVLQLHGQQYEATSINEALALLEAYEETRTLPRFERYQIHIRFNNGSETVGKFDCKPSAVEFLRMYQ